MPRKMISDSYEHFVFDVAEWRFDYGFHVRADAGPRSPLGLCWEGHYVILQGPLRSKTKRRNCAGVKVTLMPVTIDLAKWKPEMKGFGSVDGVRRGVLVANASLPSQSFHSFLTALGAGKVQQCCLSIRDVVRGAGIVDAFSTRDPAED
jgi:hypothetical protein